MKLIRHCDRANYTLIKINYMVLKKYTNMKQDNILQFSNYCRRVFILVIFERFIKRF